MSDVVWGDPIAVDGKRPAWLTDDDKILAVWDKPSGIQSVPGAWNPKSIGGEWVNVHAIRLPADHFAYTAIAKGFEPWGGGDEAPADWDGDKALMRTGHTTEVSWWDHENEVLDIIGYRKKVDAVAPDAPEPSAIVQDWLSNPDNPAGYAGLVKYAFQRVGIMPPDPTPLDKFMLAHPAADRETARLAMEWEA